MYVLQLVAHAVGPRGWWQREDSQKVIQPLVRKGYEPTGVVKLNEELDASSLNETSPRSRDL